MTEKQKTEAGLDTFLTEEQIRMINDTRKFIPWATRAWTYRQDTGKTDARGKAIWETINGELPTDEEIWWVLQRCSVWMLNAGDPKQVSVWKDKQGMHVEPSYTVKINWLDHTAGEHSTIKYVRLTGQAAKDEGSTNVNDLIYRASCVLFDEYEKAIKRGFDTLRAEALATVEGIGRVAATEYMDGNYEKRYAAPNGRTPADLARKRAAMDLISEIGGPTDAEYQSMASLDRSVKVLPQDMEGTQDLAWDSARALATSRAQRREMPALTQDEKRESAAALWGVKDDDDAIVDHDESPGPENDPAAHADEIMGDHIAEALHDFNDEEHADDESPDPNPDDEEHEPTIAESIKANLEQKTKELDQQPKIPSRNEKGVLGLFVKNMNAAAGSDDARRLITWFLFDADDGSSKNITINQARAWLQIYVTDEGPNAKPRYTLNEGTQSAMAACYAEALRATGQLDMPMEEETGDE